MVLEFMRNTFGLVMPISMILSLFMFGSEGDKNIAEAKTDETAKVESAIKSLESIVGFIFCMCIAIAATFKYKGLAWLLIIFCSSTYLRQVVYTYRSVGIIGNLVQSDNANKLSPIERWAIETLAYALWLLDLHKIPGKLMEFVAGLSNAGISDFIYICLYVCFLFLYVFLTCSLLPVILTCLSKLLVCLNHQYNKCTGVHRVINYFIDRIEKPISAQSLLIKVTRVCKKRHILLRIAVWFISPLLFAFDILMIACRMMLSFARTSVGYIFLLLRMLKHTCGKIAVWVGRVSDHRIVTLSFRLGLIAALAITVITNRYTPLLRVYEASTGTLEFIASTILIPVVFEWISSARASK